MFTGIIESIGKIEKIEHQSGDAKLTIFVGDLNMSDVALGDSIACNGVCLTAIEFSDSHYTADVSGESLKLTTLGSLAVGSSVNLEKALTPTTRLGGHLVSGHVDGVGEVVSIKKDSRSIKYQIKAPKELAHYIAKKGSICVDGVSLTVNEIEGIDSGSPVSGGMVFDINLVPHTVSETTAKEYKVGSKVNLEVDLLARYLERLLMGKKEKGDSNIKPTSNVTADLLQNSGFIK